MKKVGFDMAVLGSGHAARGIGFYSSRLYAALRDHAPDYDLEISPVGTEGDRKEFDLIHYPGFDLFYHTLPALPVRPFVVTVHDVIPLEYQDHYPSGIRGGLNLRLQRISLGFASAVITDSYASVRGISKFLGIPAAKIRLVYLSAAPQFRPLKDKKELTPVRDHYRLPSRFVLYVGDYNWNKNLPSLVRACNQLKIHLVLAGKSLAGLEAVDTSHPELAHLRELKTLVLDNPLVIRTGFVPEGDLPAVYNLATMYCQPSVAEGFGLCVLESMACGTPVVCSQTHSLPEIAGDAALFFDPHDLDDLTKAIGKVLSDARLRSRLSTAGIKQSSRFSWDKAAVDTLRVYREVLDR